MTVGEFKQFLSEREIDDDVKLTIVDENGNKVDMEAPGVYWDEILFYL